MENSKPNDSQEHCHAFCPVCGSDLYFDNYECVCKNPTCTWHCGGCSKYRDD